MWYKGHVQLIKDSMDILKRHYLNKGQMGDDKKDKDLAGYNDENRHLANFFNSDAFFIYAYKKTERLIMASYMVTDIMSDNDPLKNNVRESSLRLLSDITLLKDEGLLLKAYRSISETVLRINSLLDIAYTTGKISEMNASVLKREFQVLLERLQSYAKDKGVSVKELSFSSSFFEVDMPQPTQEDHSVGSSFSGTFSDPYSLNKTDSGSFKKEEKETAGSEAVAGQAPQGSFSRGSQTRPAGYIGNVAKNERRAAIFNLLREKKEITVRDLANVVTDCSEKTLQRELLQLVNEGILHKEGERRWSRYSLVV